MTAPTQAMFDLLDYANAGHSIAYTLDRLDAATIIDAANRGLITITTLGATVDAHWATTRAAAEQQLDLRLDITPAGREYRDAA